MLVWELMIHMVNRSFYGNVGISMNLDEGFQGIRTLPFPLPRMQDIILPLHDSLPLVSTSILTIDS